MMVALHPLLAWSLALLTLGATPSVHGHGYMRQPKTRNYVASETGTWSSIAGVPSAEYCPHCLNRRVADVGGCGRVDSRNYDDYLDSTGAPMAWAGQATFTEGGLIDVEFVLAAHHRGHVELKGCALDTTGGVTVADQDCFDAHPLTFVADDLYGANPHLAYPERGYVAPTTHANKQMSSGAAAGMLFKHQYLLPPGLFGARVLLQWHYITGNSCEDVGYDDPAYAFPDATWRTPRLPKCALPLPKDGEGGPEQFWNCAEVAITRTSPPPPPGPQPEPPAPSSGPVPESSELESGATDSAAASNDSTTVELIVETLASIQTLLGSLLGAITTDAAATEH